ncbi:hypothetical protein [Lutibacter sp.]
MKKQFVILFFTMLTFSSMLAQKNEKQKIKLLKISYITSALNLTPSEAEKFWPVYNLYSDNIMHLKQKLERGIQREVKLAGGIENISNQKAQALIDKALKLEQEITDNKIKMVHELSKIISPKKIIGLKKAEKDFNRRLLLEYRKRKNKR